MPNQKAKVWESWLASIIKQQYFNIVKTTLFKTNLNSLLFMDKVTWEGSREMGALVLRVMVLPLMEATMVKSILQTSKMRSGNLDKLQGY